MINPFPPLIPLPSPTTPFEEKWQDYILLLLYVEHKNVGLGLVHEETSIYTD